MMKTKSNSSTTTTSASPIENKPPLLWQGFEMNENLTVDSNLTINMMRPNTLNVTRERQVFESKTFIRDALIAWNERAENNYVTADKITEIFNELKYYPTEEQVNEMLQTAKLFARRSNNFETGTTTTTQVTSKNVNGLTFGEFCVLLADLKRFRTFSISKHDNNIHQQNFKNFYEISNYSTSSNRTLLNNTLINNRSSLNDTNNFILQNSNKKSRISEKSYVVSSTTTPSAQLPSQSRTPFSTSSTIPTPGSKSNENENNESVTTENNGSDNGAPEVFLGGSCNPTTWRADVAMPTLNKLGISFYNPQVSDWTPDLIELEHRAKEKARVLFFVMGSETRSSAATIEVAHIAGQNSKHLVLVLNPYKKNQNILNEAVSEQEFIDLARNQKLLRQLVSRRGLPVLDSIQYGLQRTKTILNGVHPRDPPTNIASRLISVRRAFDRVVEESKETINLIQCQKALNCLGFPNNILTLDNLKKILEFYYECNYQNGVTLSSTESLNTFKNEYNDQLSSVINFDNFCIIAAYLTVLQHEINSSSCVSPIKGFNVPPPPIFLTNTPEYIHSQQSPRISNHHHDDTNRHGNFIFEYNNKFNRDSGTSSPQPNEGVHKNLFSTDQQRSSSSGGLLNQQQQSNSSTKISVNVEIEIERSNSHNDHDDDSDSSDSVFSSGESLDDLNFIDQHGGGNDNDIRDLFLCGSCMLRTKWCQDVIIPYIKEKGLTFYLSNLHESINNKTFIYSNKNNSNNSSKSNDINNSTNEQNEIIQSSNTTSSQPHYSHDIENITRINDNCDNSSLNNILVNDHDRNEDDEIEEDLMFNPNYLDSSRVLFFFITNETRSLAPMTLAAHYIGMGYNVVLCVQMLPEDCKIGNEVLTPAAIKDYNRGRAYLIDLAKRQGIPVFSDTRKAIDCAIEKVKICKSRHSI